MCAAIRDVRLTPKFGYLQRGSKRPLWTNSGSKHLPIGINQMADYEAGLQHLVLFPLRYPQRGARP